MVTQDFTLDGVFGGPTQTVSFEGFTFLHEVRWSQGTTLFQWDNIVVTPEPGTGLLLAMGLAGLGWRRRARLS